MTNAAQPSVPAASTSPTGAHAPIVGSLVYAEDARHIGSGLLHPCRRQVQTSTMGVGEAARERSWVAMQNGLRRALTAGFAEAVVLTASPIDVAPHDR
jgi:hypothetical protein